MKKSERRMILILIIVAIIIIAVLVKVTKGGDNENVNSATENGTNVDVQNEEFVEVLEDGSKLNTSDKLSETKKFENYEISNIQLTEQNGQSVILADVKNVGEAKANMALIDITLLDKDGNEIAKIGGIIADVEPGETVQLNASATTDFANAYDFTISRTEAPETEVAE